MVAELDLAHELHIVEDLGHRFGAHDCIRYAEVAQRHSHGGGRKPLAPGEGKHGSVPG